MKIGPFTPPDVREAILWEQQHAHELPVVMLPDIYLSIAGFTIRIAAHEGVRLNFVDERILAPFRISPMDATDFTLFPELVNEQFNLQPETPGNVSGEMTDVKWTIQSLNWMCDWAPSQPTFVRCRYLDTLMNCFNAMRLFMAHQLLLQGRGFLLHASAACVKERTFVFLGHSGAGKSTSVYHSQGQLLADETIAITQRTDGNLCALGTPFGGEHFPSATPGPNPEFLFVEKSDHNARKSLSTRNAVARLLSQVVLFPFAPLELWDRAAEMVERILENHSVEILEAKKDGSFWKELLS